MNYQPTNMWETIIIALHILVEEPFGMVIFALIGLNIYREKHVSKGLKNIAEVQGKILHKLTSILESLAVRR